MQTFSDSDATTRCRQMKSPAASDAWEYQCGGGSGWYHKTISLRERAVRCSIIVQKNTDVVITYHKTRWGEEDETQIDIN